MKCRSLLRAYTGKSARQILAENGAGDGADTAGDNSSVGESVGDDGLEPGLEPGREFALDMDRDWGREPALHFARLSKGLVVWAALHNQFCTPKLN